jgi:prepilin-type N-terminal cleavage/methylation domain-containing protein
MKRAGLEREDGFSLVEMLVASLVMGLIMGGLYAMFASTETFYENYSAGMDMRQQARVSIDLISTELRYAGYDIGDLDEALTTATDTTLQFVADVDDGDDSGACDSSYEGISGGGAERITYALDTDTGILSRSVDCYDGSAWTNALESSAIAGDLSPTGAVFRFFDDDGNQLPSSSGGTLSASERAEVASVEIVLDLIETDNTQFVGEANTNLKLSARVRLHNAVH